MILIDAYALMALIGNEPAADAVEEILESDIQCALVTVNLAEVVDSLTRVQRKPQDRVEEIVGSIINEGLKLIDVNTALAWASAAMRKKHYKPRSSELSLADCFLLAATTPQDKIATGDRPILRAASKEGIGVVELA